ncbi:hypothetical protein SAMN05192583_0290 [Sphingomonas gellani]|uniref:Uncharacterized protein n=1 Tax=Sphingomonas gellani TaxID=1166340 RepID=A0A1H7YJK0_9SPHN|nr:hypothetical protein [Sphingomonas gellani]SEM46133.1 hypothetical protein SAMN05192583_0290 [Sphingomonas gellani]
MANPILPPPSRSLNPNAFAGVVYGLAVSMLIWAALALLFLAF